MNQEAATTRPRRKRSVFYSVILPLIVFVVVIGGIAWLAQNVPNWGKKPKKQHAPPKHLVFAKTVYLPESETKPEKANKTDSEKPPPFNEFVVGSSGHFDFEFENTSKKPGQLGVSYISCQCSHVKVAVFSRAEWQSLKDKNQKPAETVWKAIKESNRTGKEIPPGGYGIVRIAWEDRTFKPKIDTLLVKTWFQIHGESEQQKVDLTAPLRLVAPIRFDKHELNLGDIDEDGRRTQSLICWSPFHEKVDLHVVAGTPADRDFFDVKLKELGPQERKNLRNKLEQMGDSTKIKYAVRVHITCFAKRQYPSKKTQYMTLGPFQHRLSIKANGIKYDEAAPLIKGYISGSIIVRDIDDEGGVVEGRILLGNDFYASAGTSKNVLVTGQPGVSISVAKIQPDFVAEQKWFTIEIKDHPESTKRRPRWYLYVKLEPNKALGGRDLPDKCAVVLQINSDPPRQIRIPILGFAKRR